MLFNAKPGSPFMKVRRQIAEWPRGGVAIESKGATAVSHYNDQTQMASRRIVRATFTWEGEERPLILDFPKAKQTREVLEAAKAGGAAG